MSEPMPARLPIDVLLEEVLDGGGRAFVPVPVRARRDGWTPERQRGFIGRLALCGCVSRSARAVGMTKKSVYNLRERPDAGSFAAAWDRALGWGDRRMDDIAIERALHGEVRPYFYGGVKCGESVRHDNRLLLAALNRQDRRDGTANCPASIDAKEFEDLLKQLHHIPADTENKGDFPPI
ncbi:MAG TPA: hypothetical protein VF589_09120 [Allosphingosinicella sp.]